MSEYLDKTGLSYLWGKIKEKFNTMMAETYKSGVNCVAGKYYTFNNNLYLCTKNTDGTIAVTNTTYFTNTTVGNELSSMSEKISNDRKYELLAKGGATNSLITLNKSISNYKEIVIDCAYNGSCFGTAISSVGQFRKYVSNDNQIAFGVSTYVSARVYALATYKTDTQVYMQASDGFNIWGVK